MPNTEKPKLRQRIKAHIMRHLHSIIIQIITFSIITGFALYEIRQTRNHIQNRFDTTFIKLEEFSNRQAKRIDYLSKKVKDLGKMSLVPFHAISNAYDKAHNYYDTFKIEDITEYWNKNDKTEPDIVQSSDIDAQEDLKK